MNSFYKILDFVFLTRPVLFVPGWNTLLAGYLVSRDRGMFEFFSGGAYGSTDSLNLCLAFLGFTLAMAASFVFNQLQDVTTDQKNKKLFLLSGKYIPKQSGYLLAFVLTGISLVMAILGGIDLFMIIALFLLITAFLYNYPPFAFKNKPLSGLLSNTAMGVLAFACGWFVGGRLNTLFFMQLLPFLFFNSLLCLLTTLPDRQGDRESGKITIAVQLGVRGTLWLCGLLFIPALFFSIGLQSILTGVTVAFVPFVVYMLIRNRADAGFTVCKIGILLFTILICLFIPVYTFLPLLVFTTSRIYYRKRFNFEYPNLKGQ